MNIIGEFGDFVVRNQGTIQIAFIIILILLAAVLIVRAVTGSRKKRELLSQINQSVKEINTAVNGLGERKSGVTYIDNRVTAVPEKNASANVLEKYPDEQEIRAAAEEAEELARQAEQPAEPDEKGQPAPAEETAEDAADEPPRKYFSRDCAVSRSGRIYTLEEISSQIRE